MEKPEQYLTDEIKDLIAQAITKAQRDKLKGEQ